jgi:ABC-type transporter Mla subunit MlaD
MSGFLALMNAGQGDIDKLSSAIENCDGTSEQMAATMQDNLSGQPTILKSQLEELAISFGEILMPAIRNIVSRIQEFVDKLNRMDEGTKENIIRIGLLVAAIGPFLVILGTTISKPTWIRRRTVETTRLWLAGMISLCSLRAARRSASEAALKK